MSAGSRVRVAVIGATGSMGRSLIPAVLDEQTLMLTAAVARGRRGELGRDAGELVGRPAIGVRLQADLPSEDQADVWIDFSSPDSAATTTDAAARAGAALVVGTTGLPADGREAILRAARTVPTVVAPNMSVGVNVMLKLVADAARALGPAFDLEILELHHRRKRDAPSGTALRLAEALAEATGCDLESASCTERHGDIGPRAAGELGIQAVRGGDVAGDHTVFFLGTGERLEITHRASSRETFVQGAVRAATWLATRPAGLYDMRDVLGLR